MSGGGSPPPAPDYVGAARAQGNANLEAARLQARLGRVNQVGPTGSVTYSGQGDNWTQTTALSPEQRALYEATTRNAQSRAGIAGDQSAALAGALRQPIDFSGQPSRVSSVGANPYETDVNASSVANRNVDLSGVSPLSSDFSGERQRVEDALYGRATSRLDPQFSREEEKTRSQLINQGIREGSEGWGNAMREFENRRSDAYSDARDRSIAAGGAEQSRLYADALRGRQQGVGEAFNTAQFGNQAAQQEFQNEMARTGLYNTGQQSEFDQQMANAGLTNAARDAGINETMIPRNQLMQEFMQLYGDYQRPESNAPGTGGVQGIEAGDFQNAANQQYGYQTDMYNYDQQRRQQNTSTAASAATLAYLAYLASDPRLKTDIERTGTLENGLPTYRYRFKNESTQRIGVMSTDVRGFMPEAVIVGEDGYDRVNYTMIGAAHLLEAN